MRVDAVKLGAERWPRIVFAATALVFVGVVVYLYGFRFSAWVESDTSVTVLLAEKLIQAHSPIVGDWYYANGDVWFLSPHLLAAIPVVLFGPGPTSLWITTTVGFALELVVFVKCYRRLGADSWVAIFAALVTMMAWSNAHAAFEYIQLAYGWVTCLYLVSFTWFAVVAVAASPKRLQVVAIGVVVAVIAVQNPTRALVYGVMPVLGACVWPWRDMSVRRRVSLGAAATIGFIVAYVIYRWVLSPAVEFSLPRGHIAFAIGDLPANLAMFGRGIVYLTGGYHGAVRAVPGVVLLVGALAFVIREALASRSVSMLRFVVVTVLAQLGVVAVPLVIGNLLDGLEAIRYMMPTLLVMLGLAAVIAVRTLAETTWWRKLAIGWLVAVPIAASVAALDVKPPHPRRYGWPDVAELSAISDELVHRGLTRGFSLNLSANLLTLDSSGAAHTCPITFRDKIRPQRWLGEVECFDASALPERFYVVLYTADGQDHVAVAATLPSPIERFTVGPTYEVYVYRTSDTPTAWLLETSP